MNAQPRRQIVIEYERIQKIRKFCSTKFMICGECGSGADFITVGEAAALFETDTDSLGRFIEANRCHIKYIGAGDVYICVPSLISSMKAKKAIVSTKLIKG